MKTLKMMKTMKNKSQVFNGEEANRKTGVVIGRNIFGFPLNILSRGRSWVDVRDKVPAQLENLLIIGDYSTRQKIMKSISRKAKQSQYSVLYFLQDERKDKVLPDPFSVECHYGANQISSIMEDTLITLNMSSGRCNALKALCCAIGEVYTTLMPVGILPLGIEGILACLDIEMMEKAKSKTETGDYFLISKYMDEFVYREESLERNQHQELQHIIMDYFRSYTSAPLVERQKAWLELQTCLDKGEIWYGKSNLLDFVLALNSTLVVHLSGENVRKRKAIVIIERVLDFNQTTIGLGLSQALEWGSKNGFFVMGVNSIEGHSMITKSTLGQDSLFYSHGKMSRDAIVSFLMRGRQIILPNDLAILAVKENDRDRKQTSDSFTITPPLTTYDRTIATIKTWMVVFNLYFMRLFGSYVITSQYPLRRRSIDSNWLPRFKIYRPFGS